MDKNGLKGLEIGAYVKAILNRSKCDFDIPSFPGLP